MPFITDINPVDSAYFLLFVGESGCGKTGAAMSFPKPMNQDFDGRIKGILPLLRNKIYKTPEQMQYRSWVAPAGWAQIYKYAEELKMSCIMQKQNYKGPQTEIWDSLTNLTALLIEESKELQKGNIIANPADETLKKGANDKDYGRYSLRVSGPSDYKYEAEGMRELFSILKGLNAGIFGVKINQIFTAHVIPLWGKPEVDGKEQPYAENVIVGSRISLRDKILANILTVFDEVYEFKKDAKNRHWVQFNGELARSVLVPNDVKAYDITGKNFYEFWQKKIAEAYPNQIKGATNDENASPEIEVTL